MNNYNHYNRNLKENARKLRTESVSKAEKLLWKSLLSKKQMGVSFKRQRPVDQYIVDFISQEINLIIEIDGSSHINKSEYEKSRQDRLEFMGYHLLRFHEGEVLNCLDEISKKIGYAIHVLKDNPPPQSPSKGGRISPVILTKLN